MALPISIGTLLRTDTIPNSPPHPSLVYRTREKGKKIIEEYDL